jgi:hypothetical protein
MASEPQLGRFVTKPFAAGPVRFRVRRYFGEPRSSIRQENRRSSSPTELTQEPNRPRRELLRRSFVLSRRQLLKVLIEEITK